MQTLVAHIKVHNHGDVTYENIFRYDVWDHKKNCLSAKKETAALKKINSVKNNIHEKMVLPFLGSNHNWGRLISEKVSELPVRLECNFSVEKND